MLTLQEDVSPAVRIQGTSGRVYSIYTDVAKKLTSKASRTHQELDERNLLREWLIVRVQGKIQELPKVGYSCIARYEDFISISLSKLVSYLELHDNKTKIWCMMFITT